MGIEVLWFGVLNHKHLLICWGGLAFPGGSRRLFAAPVVTTASGGGDKGAKRHKRKQTTSILKETHMTRLLST